jgi:hypothetical protein
MTGAEHVHQCAGCGDRYGCDTFGCSVPDALRCTPCEAADMAGDDTPNPGSDAAREAGCVCAVLDNNHGLYPAVGGGWWITAGCPVHGLTDAGGDR